LAALSLTFTSQVIAEDLDDQVFIQSLGGSPVVLVTDIDSMEAVANLPGRVDENGASDGPAYDDGDHMVIDSIAQRIFVSDHDRDFAVYDFSLNLLSPTWPGFLSEPLGLAVLPSGSILITDEEDDGGSGDEALFRLNPDLSFSASATGTSDDDFDGPEGIAYDAVHNRVYMADEDDGDLVIFNATTLALIASFDTGTGGDGPYWLAVDGSSNRLFVLADSRISGDWGIHVYDISGGGDTLAYDQTLFGSLGANSDCIGSIAVSESRDRLFAADDCAGVVNVYDTATLTQLADVPAARRGSDPVMVAVGHFPVRGPIPTLSEWGLLLLALTMVLAGFFGVHRLRA
jgi:DNA-binding beta-propeller fold protein YncE